MRTAIYNGENEALYGHTAIVVDECMGVLAQFITVRGRDIPDIIAGHLPLSPAEEYLFGWHHFSSDDFKDY